MPGIKDIYRMTAPLGYALGGPAGMTEPERKSAQPVTMAQIMRDAEASRGPAEVRHPIKKIMSDRMPVDPYDPITGEKTFWRKDPIEMLKAAPGKGLDALKRLAEETIGAGPAEADINEPLGDPQYVQSMIDFLRGAINAEKYPPFGGGRNLKKIKVLEIKLGMYERLQASQGN